MDITRKLYWLMHAGITCFCNESPTTLCVISNTSIAKDDATPATAQATTLASQAKTLDELNIEKQNFQLSSLRKTAAHTLLGTGPLTPKLMCILDMPDNDSDRTGAPLTGAQAIQIQKMMNAIHLDMGTDVYLTYLSPWRTPGNRPLTSAESALFIPFLSQEIHLVRPEIILLFGSGTSNALLNLSSLSKARGKWHMWDNIPTRVTLSISMLKTTTLRRQAWMDLQEVEKKLSTP